MLEHTHGYDPIDFDHVPGATPCATIMRVDDAGAVPDLADKLAIDARDVSIVYGSGQKAVVALDGITITVTGNEFVAIIGPSGCGKSSLLKAVCDLLPPDVVQGTIEVHGKAPPDARRDNAFAFVFQDPVLAPWRTVLANVSLPLEIVGAPKHEIATLPRELVELVGLGGFENALPHSLSGGMRQRVAIARALTLEPSVLLLDEPFGALDELTRDYMHDELLKIWRTTEASVLLVTHSIPEAVYLSDRVLILSARPGSLAGSVEIPFQRPRDPRIKTSIEFLEKANEVRDLLSS